MNQNFFYKQDTLPRLVEENEPPLPTQIGPYKIEGLLGKGGMSYLYLGIHPDSHKLVAIKVLPPSLSSNDTALERFFKESHIISLSNHPNIVKLFGEGRWEHGAYIAMEWVRGISLRQFIMQQSLSMRRALDIILQVAYALHHLHSHGIVHRDLKPENILITEEGGIKVIDFGIAQLGSVDQSTKKQEPQWMGTPSYMSPEQKEDPLSASFASDIYSLGVISYEIIIGKLSFGIVQPSVLPSGLRKIIEKALALSLQERYGTITDFINDISLYLNSKEVDRERPGSDQIKEVIETFQRVSQGLSTNIQGLTEIDIGIAKHHHAVQFGLCSDFFRFPNGALLFTLIESCVNGVESIVYASYMKGALRTLLLQHQKHNQLSWNLEILMTELNEELAQESNNLTFGMSMLLLSPLRDQLFFLNAGLNSLIHFSGEGEPKELTSQNPLIGKEKGATFNQLTYNWNIGDTLILHSAAPAYRTEPYQQRQTEKSLIEILKEDSLLSAQPQAESLMKKALSLSFQREQKQAKLLYSIQRIT